MKKHFFRRENPNPPKTINDAELWPRHALSGFHIPVLHKFAVSRSKVGINNVLRSETASRARERGHLPPARRMMIDAVSFRRKEGSIYQDSTASTGRRLGSPDALKRRSTAIMQRRTSRGR